MRLLNHKSKYSATNALNGQNYGSGKHFGFCGCVVSDVGHRRVNNEDNYVLGKYMNVSCADHSQIQVSVMETGGIWRFAGVFDGMGGGDKGELAAKLTAEVFMETFERLDACTSKAEADLAMRKAFLEANNKIVDLQQKYKIFGTTGTVICTNGMEFKIYHLGDSRAYLLRDGDLFQLTRDQTLAQMKLDAGLYEADDPQVQMDKHKLTEFIGRDWTRENIYPIESDWMAIRDQDCLLLCSDGLYDMCSDGEIRRILLGDETLETAATKLVDAALEHGGDDNITCLLIGFC